MTDEARDNHMLLTCLHGDGWGHGARCHLARIDGRWAQIRARIIAATCGTCLLLLLCLLLLQLRLL